MMTNTAVMIGAVIHHICFLWILIYSILVNSHHCILLKACVNFKGPQ